MILDGITLCCQRWEVGEFETKFERSRITRGPICPSISRSWRHPLEVVRSCYEYNRFVSNASNLPIAVPYRPRRSMRQYPILAIRDEP